MNFNYQAAAAVDDTQMHLKFAMDRLHAGLWSAGRDSTFVEHANMRAAVTAAHTTQQWKFLKILFESKVSQLN